MVHQEKPALKQDAADLQCHSKRTAEEQYVIVDKESKASVNSKKIMETQRMCAVPSRSTELHSIFDEEVQSNTIDLAIVRSKIDIDERLKELRGDKRSTKKLLDALRYKALKVNENTEDRSDTEI